MLGALEGSGPSPASTGRRADGRRAVPAPGTFGMAGGAKTLGGSCPFIGSLLLVKRPTHCAVGGMSRRGPGDVAPVTLSSLRQSVGTVSFLDVRHAFRSEK
jgi:hypothetical protein